MTPPHPVWQCAGHAVPLGRTLVMGIVNVTPDSFSDGFLAPGAAIAHAVELAREGADILDIGAESSRPGAREVPPEEETARLLHVVRVLRSELALPLSVDTRHPETARVVLAEGAAIINDISAGEAPGMFEAVRNAGAGMVLMRAPSDWWQRPGAATPCAAPTPPEVLPYLQARLAAAEAAGIPHASLVVDPGLGFAGAAEEDVLLFKQIGALATLAPVLVGASRKRFIGTLGDEPAIAKRLGGSVAAAVCAARRGAKIVRVHDVAATVQALRVAEALW